LSGYISIYPEIPKLNNETPFHRNIIIENNVFHPFDYPVLYAKSVDNINFVNNKIIGARDLKPFTKGNTHSLLMLVKMWKFREISLKVMFWERIFYLRICRKMKLAHKMNFNYYRDLNS